MKRILFTVMLAFAALHVCSAQFAVTVLGEAAPLASFPKAGAGGRVSLGWDLKYSYLEFGAGARYSLEEVTAVPSEGEEAATAGYDRMRYYATAAFYLRALGNESHSLNAYLGGGAFAGTQGYASRAGDAEGTDGAPKGGVVYGVYPSIQLEAFITRNLALVATGCWEFGLGDEKGKGIPFAGIGVRYLMD